MALFYISTELYQLSIIFIRFFSVHSSVAFDKMLILLYNDLEDCGNIIIIVRSQITTNHNNFLKENDK